MRPNHDNIFVALQETTMHVSECETAARSNQKEETEATNRRTHGPTDQPIRDVHLITRDLRTR